MSEQNKRRPVKIITNKIYSILLYEEIREINREDKLFFNYVLERSQRTNEKDKDGKVIYKQSNLGLSKITDIAYIERLLKNLERKKDNKEITYYPYFAKKIEREDGKLLQYCINKEYKQGEIKKRTKDCLFPCYEIPILLNFLKIVNYEIHNIYLNEKNEYKNFYGYKENVSPPEENDFHNEIMDDDIPL